MELGTLVKYGYFGKVHSTSGVTRTVAFSWTFRMNPVVALAINKTDYYSQINAQIVQPFVNNLHADLFQSETFIHYANLAGDQPASMGVVAETGRAGARLSLNMGVFIRTRTNSRGRRYMGAKIAAPIVASDVSGDELTAGALTTWQNIVLPWTTPFVVHHGLSGDNIISMVVWSRVASAGDTTVPPGIGDDVVAVNVNKTLTTWRHRRERVVR